MTQRLQNQINPLSHQKRVQGGINRHAEPEEGVDGIMPDVVTDGIKRYEVPEKWKPANIVR